MTGPRVISSMPALCRRRCGNRHLLTPSLSQSSGSCAVCEACGPRLTPTSPHRPPHPRPLVPAFASLRQAGLESCPRDTPHPQLSGGGGGAAGLAAVRFGGFDKEVVENKECS